MSKQNIYNGTNVGIPKEPFLPLITKNKEYTLVLDLDETLIHYDVDEKEREGFYLIRPGALKFLYEMKYYYEIVVFTAAIPEVIIFLFILNIYLSMQIGL
jgi:hypothetical protein